MSLLWMVKALSTRVKNSSRKLVLIKLSDNANDEGICWPSITHIAAQCEMSTRTVQRHLRDLEKAGFIQIEERQRNNFVNRSNLYTLKFSEGQVYSPESDPSSGGEEPLTSEASVQEGDNMTPPFQEGDNLTPYPDTVTPRGVTQCHPEPVSLESVSEPSSVDVCAREDDFPDPGGDTRQRFVMFADWQVQKDFLENCRIRGLLLEKLDPHVLSDEVRDFVCYWMARPETVLTQSLWENKLAQHLQRAIRRGVFNTNNMEFGHAKQSGHSQKPKSAAQYHAESCAGAFDYYAGQSAGEPADPGGYFSAGDGVGQSGENAEFSSVAGSAGSASELPDGYGRFGPAPSN